MRSALLTCVATCVAIPALTAQNEFGVYPEAVSFFSRLPLPITADGDITQRYAASEVRGVGWLPGRTAGGLIGFRVLIQDQDCSTIENYTLAILPDDGTGRPDPNPANELLRTAPIPMPSGGPVGACAWIITVTLTTPADVIPVEDTWHLALGVPANATANDGLYSHAGSYTAATGDNPKTTAPNPSWGINRTSGTVSQAAARTWRMYVLTDAPTLKVGADIDPALQKGPNPSFGMAGHYPNRARGDGLAFRLHDAASPAGQFAIFGTPFGFQSPPIQIPGIDGQLLMAGPLVPIAFLAGALDGAGDATGVVPFGMFPQPVPLGVLVFQAAIVPTSGNPRLSNAVASDDT